MEKSGQSALAGVQRHLVGQLVKYRSTHKIAAESNAPAYALCRYLPPEAAMLD